LDKGNGYECRFWTDFIVDGGKKKSTQKWFFSSRWTVNYQPDPNFASSILLFSSELLRVGFGLFDFSQIGEIISGTEKFYNKKWSLVLWCVGLQNKISLMGSF
jgi:hypothetical protein